VESNEDGFTLRNVQAICATGESSKKLDTTTTGEKGFGFKSVFGIANRVHVQSRFWSFSFRHNSHDDGLGMITPIWTDPSHHPLYKDIRTSFTLSYSDGSPDFLQRLIKEFDKHKAEILFALRKLVRVVISHEHISENVRTIVFEKKGNSRDEYIDIIQRSGNGEAARKQRYRNASYVVSNMPNDDLRMQSESYVQIGFPVNLEKNKPVRLPKCQNVFAYLPVTQVAGLPFLIQADFVLIANRQDILDTEWNTALLEGIVFAFVEEVKAMCKGRGSLRHVWMRFLPSQQDLGFFCNLYASIQQRLRKAKVFETRTAGKLVKASRIRIVPDQFTHQGDALFEDLDECDIYISTEYATKDYPALRGLGLEELSEAEMLDRTSGDRLQEKDIGDSWHASFVDFAQFLQQSTVGRSCLSELEMIPIMQAKELAWVSESSLSDAPVGLPYIVHEDSMRIAVPSDLRLSTLHPLAFADGARRAFFEGLGVTECEPTMVVDTILDRHKVRHQVGPIHDIVTHFEILFWFSTSYQQTVRGKIRALNAATKLRRPRLLYLHSDQPFGTKQLLRFTETSKSNAYLLHPLFEQSPMKSYVRDGKPWERWLAESFGIRTFPRLQSPSDASELDPVLRQIAEDNPAELLPMLREHWSVEYAVVCHVDPNIAHEISMLEVPTLPAGDLEALRADVFTYGGGHSGCRGMRSTRYSPIPTTSLR